jgi:hypothetical protein
VREHPLPRRRTTDPVRSALALLAALPAVAAAAPPAPTARSFLTSLFAVEQPALEKRFDADYRYAVSAGLPDTPGNRAALLRALFVYDLVKTDGVLQNQFLIREADGRHPDVMLRDAFAPAPRYKKVYSLKRKEWDGVPATDGATLFSFGRCDEYEMLEASLLQKVFGLRARVAMVWENHVVTQVALDGGYLFLDSSFQRCIAFSKRALVDAPPEDGVYSIARVNRLALRDLHQDLPLDPRGAERVRAAAHAWFAAPPKPLYCPKFSVYALEGDPPRRP